MVYVTVGAGVNAAQLVAAMEARGVLAFNLDETTVRLVCHFELESDAVERVAATIVDAARAVAAAASSSCGAPPEEGEGSKPSMGYGAER